MAMVIGDFEHEFTITKYLSFGRRPGSLKSSNLSFDHGHVGDVDEMMDAAEGER